MSLNTQGIVIREQTLRENDKMISILTKDHGVVKAYVFGAKKPGGRLSSSTQLFAYSDFSLKSKNDFYTVEHAVAKEVFFELRNDIEVITLAQYFAQLEEEFASESEGKNEYLRLMLNSLHILCKRKRPFAQVKAVFELRIMCLSGYMPDILMCSGCGKYEDETMFFDMNKTTLSCRSCSDGSGRALDLGLLRSMRHICYSDHEKIFNFSLSEEGYEKMSSLTQDYLLFKAKRTFKTLDFYNALTRGDLNI
ncbi:MAG: DNA repair protein RecO [Clostridia bacterium]|nr:DNA repair protein RecO [Clostridia bacterium]